MRLHEIFPAKRLAVILTSGFPFRYGFKFNETTREHIRPAQRQDSNEPLNYLHLAHPEVDIQGSKIIVYYLFNTSVDQAFAIVFNFQDGRWKKAVEEPILRLRDI